VQVVSRPSLRRRSRSSEGARDSPLSRWMTEAACRTRVPSRSVSQRASRAPSGGTTHTPRRHPQRVPCQCHSPSIHTDSGRGRGGTTSARIAGGGNGTSTNSSAVWGDAGSDGSDEPQPQPQSIIETIDTWRSMGRVSTQALSVPSFGARILPALPLEPEDDEWADTSPPPRVASREARGGALCAGGDRVGWGVRYDAGWPFRGRLRGRTRGRGGGRERGGGAPRYRAESEVPRPVQGRGVRLRGLQSTHPRHRSRARGAILPRSRVLRRAGARRSRGHHRRGSRCGHDRGRGGLARARAPISPRPCVRGPWTR
jgi:hypothetical protein